MGSQNQAAATFGAGLFLALGLVGLMSTSFINQATTLSLDPFLQLWTETILEIVFAFVLIIAAFLVGSKVGMGSVIGGVLGTLVSIVGAIDSLLLLSLTYGIVYPSSGYIESLSLTPQLIMSVELLFLITIAVLVVGLPLVLVGSFQHLREKSDEGT